MWGVILAQSVEPVIPGDRGRHCGSMVAAAVPGPRAAALIGVDLVVAALVSIPYLRWRRRAQQDQFSALE